MNTFILLNKKRKYITGNKQLLFSPEYETILNDSNAATLGQLSYRKGFEISREV